MPSRMRRKLPNEPEVALHYPSKCSRVHLGTFVPTQNALTGYGFFGAVNRVDFRGGCEGQHGLHGLARATADSQQVFAGLWGKAILIAATMRAEVLTLRGRSAPAC
jgi:hypothetical protein